MSQVCSTFHWPKAMQPIDLQRSCLCLHRLAFQRWPPSWASTWSSRATQSSCFSMGSHSIQTQYQLFPLLWDSSWILACLAPHLSHPSRSRFWQLLCLNLHQSRRLFGLYCRTCFLYLEIALSAPYCFLACSIGSRRSQTWALQDTTSPLSSFCFASHTVLSSWQWSLCLFAPAFWVLTNDRLCCRTCTWRR